MTLGQCFSCGLVLTLLSSCFVSTGCGESEAEKGKLEAEKFKAKMRQQQVESQLQFEAQQEKNKQAAAKSSPPAMPAAMASLNPQQQGQYVVFGHEIAGHDWTTINFRDFTLGQEEVYDALLPEIEQSFASGPEFNTDNVLKEIAKRDPFARDLSGFRLTYGPSLAVAERMKLNVREKFELLLLLKKGRPDDLQRLLMTTGALLDGKPLQDQDKEYLARSPLTRRTAKALAK
jgi:hypothetical protein